MGIFLRVLLPVLLAYIREADNLLPLQGTNLYKYRYVDLVIRSSEKLSLPIMLKMNLKKADVISIRRQMLSS